MKKQVNIKSDHASKIFRGLYYPKANFSLSMYVWFSNKLSSYLGALYIAAVNIRLGSSPRFFTFYHS